MSFLEFLAQARLIYSREWGKYTWGPYLKHSAGIHRLNLKETFDNFSQHSRPCHNYWRNVTIFFEAHQKNIIYFNAVLLFFCISFPTLLFLGLRLLLVREKDLYKYKPSGRTFCQLFYSGFLLASLYCILPCNTHMFQFTFLWAYEVYNS